MANTSVEVEEKVVDSMLIAGIRMRGKYSDCGKGFATIGKKFGMNICGKPMMLIYDSEYKAEDAEFEPCMPVRKGESRGDISVREISGGRCASLLHHGPYEELSRSYKIIRDYLEQKNLTVSLPCREVYLKGPGMIFKGNPKKYITEIQMFIEQPSEA